MTLFEKTTRLALFAVTLATLFAFPALANNAAAAKGTVMVFGDSLSAGYGLRPNEGWVSLMQKELTPLGVAVVNASISGETTSGGVSRIKADLARHKPTVVVIALGANDGLRGLAVAEMRRNLETILSDVSRAGARAVLVGIQIPPNYGIQYAEDFKAVFPKLAAERKLPLVPFLLDGIAENLDNFQPDRLHPIASAQPRILQNVLPVVQKVVKSAAPSSRAPAKL
jgi:acyl-CoA thioesterase-1